MLLIVLDTDAIIVLEEKAIEFCKLTEISEWFVA